MGKILIIELIFIHFITSICQDVSIDGGLCVGATAQSIYGFFSLLLKDCGVVTASRSSYTLLKQSSRSIAEFLETDGSICPETEDLIRLKFCLSFLQRWLALRAEMRSSYLSDGGFTFGLVGCSCCCIIICHPTLTWARDKTIHYFMYVLGNLDK